jgi:two-component system chemotaxis sensor kinase CheA
LAEDSSFFRNQVHKLFESKGYRVEACEDGLEAWEKLTSGEYDFDVLVTDIEMPNMNGFELCTRLKANARWKNLPVIALTSLAAAADMQRGIDAGIDDYQIKMDKDKLLGSLQNFVDHTKKNTKSPAKSSRKLATGGVK